MIASEAETAIARQVAAAREPLLVRGAGTKAGMLRPVQAAGVISTAGLTGITLYAPKELIISARAGTPLHEIETALAEHGQHLIAEPPDLSGLFGTAANTQTLGGVVATNLSGPRRVAWGAMRDHVMGIRAVTGHGEVIHSGGRVLKNVTGLDLCKLLTGSHGTLGIITEITLKVLPAPEAVGTIVISGLDAQAGVAALSAALGSPYGVSGAVWLPDEAAALLPDVSTGRSLTLICIEEFVDFRRLSHRKAARRTRLCRRRHSGGLRVARAVAGGARRTAAAGNRRRRHLARLGASFGRSGRAANGGERARLSRLGWRPGVVRRPRDRGDPPRDRGRRARRRRHLDVTAGAGLVTRRGRRGAAGSRTARGDHAARQAGDGPPRDSQPGPDLRGVVGACRPISPKRNCAIPRRPPPTRCCGAACIAGCAPRHVPTFQLLGDELDSPRGRIYLIKDMLEQNRPAPPEVVLHIDRCLSCLSCMTTCPSGVNYMHLVDHARTYIERTFRRPWHERLIRGVLGLIIPRPRLFRLALACAGLPRPLARLLPGRSMLARRVRAMFAGAGERSGTGPERCAAGLPAAWPRKARVALLAGCAQRVLAPEINAATIRLLTRLGCEVVVAEGAGCCGSLNHHMGQHDPAMALDREHRGLEPGNRQRRPRRGGDQRVRLRHHGEGLRLHVPQRTG